MHRSDFSVEKVESEDVCDALIKEYQSLSGAASWGCKTRPQTAFCYSCLSKYSSRPTERLMRFMQVHKDKVCLRSLLNILFMKLRLWSDASYARLAYTCRVGHVMQVVHKDDDIPPNKSWENCVEWRSKQISMKVASTTSAELLALRDSCKVAWMYINMWNKMFMAELPIEICIDSDRFRLLCREGREQGCV